MLLFALSGIALAGGTQNDKLNDKSGAKTGKSESASDPPPAFARASSQAASIQKQREAVEKQRLALGAPKSENPFFLLPSAFTIPADSSFFVLAEH
ncbi:MAG: hypothetical protein ACR2I2_09080 [Bryobacteraceae bacterium]